MVKSTLGESLTLNLSKLPRVDKSDQVASFVKQQERNAKVYKAEGLRYVEVWGKENAYSVSSGAPGNPPRVENGGGMDVMTPVLKARNPGRGLDIVHRQVVEGRRDTTGEKDPPSLGAKGHAEPSRSDKKGAKGGLERTKSSPSKKSSKQTKAQKNTKSPKKGMDTDVQEGSENTEERDRQARMDQRKQRRKEKRDIVNPRKRKASPMDDGSDGSAQKKRSSKKASRRQKVPAGLALMHGFSATNVGKSRLTIEPMRAMGVFSRGKVSSKANTDKTSKGKQGICDLEAFFGKPKAKTSKRARSTVATSESEEEEERPKVAAAKKPCLKPSKAPKAKASQKQTSKDASSSGSATSESDEDRDKVSHRPRAPSVAWSIERESALLPSTDISVSAPVKALAVEGGVPKEPSVANSTEVSRPPSGKSSLGPHDSASQCVAMSRPDPPKFETFSKYFGPRPAEAHQASECAEEKSMVVPCPRFSSKADQISSHFKDSALPRTHFAQAELDGEISRAPMVVARISESREEVIGLEDSEDHGGVPQEDPIWPQVPVESRNPEIRMDRTAFFPTPRARLCDGSGTAVSTSERSPRPEFIDGRVRVSYPSSLIDDNYPPLDEEVTVQDAAFQGYETFDGRLEGEYTIQEISQHDELANVYRAAGEFTQWECLGEPWLEDEQEGTTDVLYPGQDYPRLTARGEEYGYWQADDEGGNPERRGSPFHGACEDIRYEYEGMELEAGTDEEVEQDAYDSGDASQEEALTDIHSKADSSQLGEESQQESESLAGVCQFLSGRSALLGFNAETGTMRARAAEGDSEKYGGVSKVELDVGRNLKDHWRPQRLY